MRPKHYPPRQMLSTLVPPTETQTMDITVSVTGLDEITHGFGVIEQQLPYAISRGINATLDAMQTAVRTHLHDGTFFLRRPDFIDKTIYIAPSDRATKTRLVGTVRVDPERNFLAKFEDGGQKDPSKASTIAVPVFKQASPSLIVSRSDPLYIKKLMASLDRTGAARGRVRNRKGAPKRLVPQKVYLVKTAKGTLLVERTGPGQTRVLYAFERSVPIKADLHFEEIALRTAEAQWDALMSQALEDAIASAR